MAQGDSAAEAAIKAALTQWTADFNAGRADKVCDLFAPDVIAQVRGAPERDHQAVCALLKRSLADTAKTYRYSFTIQQIMVVADLAVVRLTWTLRVQNRGAPGESLSLEPGMDIFRKQPDGSWKIVRYMAYEAPP